MRTVMVVICFCLCGCQPIDRETRHPIQQDVVLAGVSPEVGQLDALWDAFWKEGGRKPSSCFTVWRDGTRFSHICVPKQWGGRILKQKASFLKKAKGLIHNGGSLNPEVTNDREAKPIVVATVAGNKALSMKPCHVAVLCDRSWAGSIACGEEAPRVFFEHWAYSCGAATGSSFRIVVPGWDADSTEIVFRAVVTDSESKAQQVSVFPKDGRGIPEKLRPFRPSAHMIEKKQHVVTKAGSAIAEALGIIGRDTKRNADEPFAVMVLSDMRQVSLKLPEERKDTRTRRVEDDNTGEQIVVLSEDYIRGPKWNFEKSVPPPDEFVNWLKEQKIGKGLDGATIRICGISNHGGERRVTLQSRDRLEETWKAAFKLMGTKEPDFNGCLP